MIKQTSLHVIKQTQSSQKSILHFSKNKKQQKNVFVSREERFTQRKQNNNSPGPGAYIDPLQKNNQLQKNQQKSKIKQSKANHLDSFVSREHQWIFGSNRFTFLNNKIDLGPGAYDLDRKQINNVANSWSKAGRFNSNYWANSENQIGPGSYHAQKIQNKQKKQQMGIFKSRSPKTFLEALQKNIEKVVLNYKIKNNFQDNNEQMQQIQKLAKSQIKIKKQVKMDSVFQSKSKRYQIKNPQHSHLIGPGYYNLDIQSIQNIKRRKINSIVKSNLAPRHKIQSETSINLNPGPTSYNMESYSIEKQIQKKISSIKGSMPLQTRFKDSEPPKDIRLIPGPGHYGRQKFMFIDEKQYEHKPLVSHHQKILIPFMSCSPRKGIEKDSNSISIGNYNLNQFDLSQKARKKRYHLQKLKAMDISVPGFERAERRTTFNLSKILRGNSSKLKSGTNII